MKKVEKIQNKNEIKKELGNTILVIIRYRV